MLAISRFTYILRTRCQSTSPCSRQSFKLWTSRRLATSAQEVENINVDHSRFLAEAPAEAKWKDTLGKGRTEATGEDFDSITEGKGKLSPTSSHLFKLILPLGHLRPSLEPQEQHHTDTSPTNVKSPPPTVFLLHPSQPLSHVSRLILASLAPATPRISFQCLSPRSGALEWSDSTDVADFIRDAARATEFAICIQDQSSDAGETVLHVEIPSFADRTRFLRRRLELVQRDLARMEGRKRECDIEAFRGARRMALGGFGILVVYWGAVARLTFWDFGWDFMEPLTYLSGLSTVILGYSWFLYQGREVSYSSVLQRSISARRDALYKAHGLDIERWQELVSEAKGLRKEIGKIAEDYDERPWKEREEQQQQQDQADDDSDVKVPETVAERYNPERSKAKA
ncbi:hypothetical protein B0H21DRAFT_435380 [Amylocystis lapponica]|nr:hypothetical protein B0H21DRAFT_435380 [Amylocystis lapponica]